MLFMLLNLLLNLSVNLSKYESLIKKIGIYMNIMFLLFKLLVMYLNVLGFFLIDLVFFIFNFIKINLFF